MTQYLTTLFVVLSTSLMGQLPQEFRFEDNGDIFQGTSFLLDKNPDKLFFGIGKTLYEANKAGMSQITPNPFNWKNYLFYKELANGNQIHVGSDINQSGLGEHDIFWKLLDEEETILSEGNFEIGIDNVFPNLLTFLDENSSTLYIACNHGLIQFDYVNEVMMLLTEWELGEITGLIKENGIFYFCARDGQVGLFDTSSGTLSIATPLNNANWEGIQFNSSNNLVVFGSNTNTERTISLLSLNLQIIDTQHFGTGRISSLLPLSNGAIIGASTAQNANCFNCTTSIFKITENELEWEEELGKGLGKHLHQFDDNRLIIALTQPGGTSSIIYFDENGQHNEEVLFYAKHGGLFDVNNIKTPFSSRGSLFGGIDIEGGGLDWFDIYFNVPKNEPTASIHYAALWMGGYDEQGDLRMACNMFSSEVETDFRPGNFANHPGLTQIWKINQSQIDGFLLDLSDGNIDHDIPFPILTWPALGNSHCRSYDTKAKTIEEDYAPFVDTNGDGIYNAYDGDYPVIKGDQMLWWLMNDYKIHTASQSDTLGVEVACSVYGFNNPDNLLTYNTLYMDFDIMNKGDFEFTDFKIGIWQDHGLGCNTDDAAGVDTTNHFMYTYNIDEDDGPCLGSSQGYDAPPLQTMSFLNREISAFVTYPSYNNNPPPFGGDPNYSINYYEYLSGQLLDGALLTVGGWGNDQANPATNFHFPSNPLDPNEWSMCQEELTDHHVRTITSSHVGDFASGETIDFKLAFTFFPEYGACPDISAAQDSLRVITSTKKPLNVESAAWNVFPNPTHVELNFNIQSSISDYQINIRDLTGKLISSHRNTSSINVEHLASGLYVVQLVSKKGRLLGAKKVIIQ